MSAIFKQSKGVIVSAELDASEKPNVLTIPNKVKRTAIKGIGNGFNDRSSISLTVKELVIEDGVEVIGENAFRMMNLKKVTLPESIKVIGASAFLGCSELEIINFPSSLESIGASAFNGCEPLKDVNLAATACSFIGANAFANTSIDKDSFTLPYFLDFESDSVLPSFGTKVWPSPVGALAPKPTSASSYSSGIAMTVSLIKGSTFTITGTFSLYRVDLENLITKYGGYISSSISSSTDYLLVGTKPGATKLNAAKKRMIKMIDLDEVEDFIKHH